MGGRSIGKLRDEMAEAGIQIGTGTLHRAVKGELGNRVESLEKIAQFFRVTADQLLQPDLGAQDDSTFADVPRKKVALSAGRGREAHVEDIVGTLKFRRDFLRSVGASPTHAAIVDVDGHSMEPTLPDGAVVMVNTNNRERADRRLYAIRVGDELFVKRLVRHGDQWIARSDNEDRELYPDIDLQREDVEIIGRAVWMGTRL
jgi:phage repressor protein C with HTH and peptisase S24 domain